MGEFTLKKGDMSHLERVLANNQGHEGFDKALLQKDFMSISQMGECENSLSYLYRRFLGIDASRPPKLSIVDKNLLTPIMGVDVLLSTKIIQYMVKANGKNPRNLGDLYSIHTLEAGVLAYQSGYDFVAGIGGLLHDILEEKDDATMKLIADGRFENWSWMIPSIKYKKFDPRSWTKKINRRRVHKELQKSGDYQVIHDDHVEQLNDFFNKLIKDYVPLDQQKEYEQKFSDSMQVINSVTRLLDHNYYNVIGQITRSGMSFENICRAFKVKMKDRVSNNRSLDVPSYARKDSRLAKWLMNKEATAQDLARYADNNEKGKLWWARKVNRVSHFFNDIGPYKNSAKVKSAIKNEIIMRQARDYYLNLKELYDNKLSMTKHLEVYNMKFDKSLEANDLNTYKGLETILTDMIQNKAVCKQVLRLRQHLDEDHVYYNNKEKVDETLDDLKLETDVEKEMLDLYLKAEHAYAVLQHYEMTEHEKHEHHNIAKFNQFFEAWDRLGLDKDVEDLNRKNKNVLERCVTHSRKYHVHPEEYQVLVSETKKIEHLEELTQKDITGVAYHGPPDRFHGYFERELDTRVRKRELSSLQKIKIKWQDNPKKVLERALVLERINQTFMEIKTSRLRGQSADGIALYRYGFEVDLSPITECCEEYHNLWKAAA